MGKHKISLKNQIFFHQYLEIEMKKETYRNQKKKKKAKQNTTPQENPASYFTSAEEQIFCFKSFCLR